MTDRCLPVRAIITAAIGLGVAGDLLLRASGGPGLNFLLLFAGLAVSVWIAGRDSESPPGREAAAWMGVGVLCAAALLWRGSGLLRFVTFVAACAAFALPALEAGRGWVRRSGVLDVVEAVLGAGVHAVFGGFRLMQRRHWGSIGTEEGHGTARGVARTALVGTLLAVVPLVVFGALFISADEVFATIIGDFVRVDLEVFASHLLAIGVLTWLACGYLVGVSSGTRLNAIRDVRPIVPSFGVAEVATALALVDLLFLGFVTVQFRYLFGGAGWVEVTPGLTYAAYARAGFFQLVAAVALAVPWLLVTHTLLDNAGAKGRAAFFGFAGVHVLLLFAIVASAIQRMVVYQAAYGLTEERVVATAVLVWLTVVLVWFWATVSSGRRDRFAFGGLVTAFVLIGALQLLNPAGLVARHNLDRADASVAVDVEYLASLGSDAAPHLLAHLDELAEESQCLVAHRLLDRWGPDRPADWRSFNWSESLARRAVRREATALGRYAAGVACP